MVGFTFGKIGAVVLYLSLISGLSYAQESTFGIPYYKIYTTSDYPSEQQNFDLVQWNDGSIIFGNSGGVLQHSDDEWRVFGQMDAAYVVSIEQSLEKSNILWATPYGNIGYFEQEKTGVFNYYSLTESLPQKSRNLGQVYTIKESGDFVFFLSEFSLIQYSKSDSTAVISEEIEYGSGQQSKVLGLEYWGDGLIAFLDNGAVATYSPETDSWNQVFISGPALNEVYRTHQSGNQIYLADANQGLHRFDGETIQKIETPINEFLTENRVSDIILTDNKEIIISTRTAGTVMLDNNGMLKYFFSENTGFPEDDHKGLLIDSSGDLWIVTNSHIFRIYIGVPVTHYSGETYGFGDALGIKEYNGRLYIGSTNGLFRMDVAKGQPLSMSAGELFYQYKEVLDPFWVFLEVEDELWVGSEVGVFNIEGDNISQIAVSETRQLYRLNDEIILAITYNGIDWFLKENGIWNYKGPIDGIDSFVIEGCIASEFEFWGGDIQSQIYRGIYNPDNKNFDIKKFTQEDGLPATDMIEPTWIQDELYVSTRRGSYYFYKEEERFYPREEINKVLGGFTEFLIEDHDQNLWSVYTDSTGYRGVLKLENENENWIRKFTPFEITSNHYGDFIEITEKDIWVGATESVMHMSLDSRFIPKKPSVYLWEILSLQDQMILSYASETPSVIAYAQKNIQLDFASTSYRYPEKNQFRFKVGNTEWSEWRSESELTIDPLLPGTKNIWVQTRDFMLEESEPAMFSISIIAPWYLSNFAYLIYGIGFLAIMIVLVRTVSSYRIRQQVNQLKLQEIEKIIELDELKTKLLINISHELRTPLTLVNGPIKQLLDSNKVEDDYLLRKLQVAHRNGRRLHDLVEQVLDLSKLDSNIIDFAPSQIQFCSFIKRVSESFESGAERKSISIKIDIPEKEILFQGDADKLEKVLVNLLSNAIKFTPEKGNIEIILEEKEDSLKIQVEDSGRGISSDDLEYVFDRFHSTSDQLEGGGQGIGVGLSITKEFVELHDGEIRVESEEGKGAVFSVTLPKKEYEGFSEIEFQKIDSDTKDKDELLPALSSFKKNGSDYSALVVEDNPDMRVYISELLNELGISVEQAANGIEGKKQVSVKKPDIIISDIMMPEMNGFEFTSWVRSVPESRQIPVILLSARSEVEDKVHGFEIGVSDYLTKPFNAQELQARVDNLLTLKKEREQFSDLKTEVEQSLSADAELVQQLQEFVEGKIGSNDISVDELAASAAMSVRNLQRILKSVTGFTPVEFIREVRLYSARHLLETKQKRTVSEVAYEVGFSTPAYFSKLYKKRFGTSPSDYF